MTHHQIKLEILKLRDVMFETKVVVYSTALRLFTIFLRLSIYSSQKNTVTLFPLRILPHEEIAKEKMY